jgi:phosphopentomutase
VDAVLQTLRTLDSGLVFANLVDFDAKYGHRRDPAGMSQNVTRFDDRLPELLGALTPEDLLIITADHGNDPTFRGTDHTRERVPLLVVEGDAADGRDLGVREGFHDVGASVAAWLGVERGDLPGAPFVRG